jgi:hypothetical protein
LHDDASPNDGRAALGHRAETPDEDVVEGPDSAEDAAASEVAEVTGGFR